MRGCRAVQQMVVSKFMTLIRKTFRLLLVTAVTLAVAGRGMPALGRACMERREALTPHAEHEDCRDAAPESCDEACARLTDPEHEDASDACACSVEPWGAERTGLQKSAKSRVPRETRCFPGICSLSSCSPGRLNTPGAMSAVVDHTAAHLPALRTVVLRL